jgi:hypothetical protein
MRVKPLAGRTLTQEDDQRGAAKVAIVSHRLWRQTFGEDPAMVGRILELVYALALSVVTGLAFGLTPSLTITRGSTLAHLRGDSMPHGNRSRQTLVVAQIAMTVVLLCAGGLLTRSLDVLAGTKTGMDVEHVLTMNVGLPERRMVMARGLRRTHLNPGLRNIFPPIAMYEFTYNPRGPEVAQAPVELN